MKKEEFAAKIRELCISPDNSVTATWIEFAEENAQYHTKYLEDCGGAYDDFTKEMAQHLTVEANLDDLHNAFLCVHNKFGSEVAQLIYLVGFEKQHCLYPNEFMHAAHYLHNGGSIDQIVQLSLDEFFENGNLFWECSEQDCCGISPMEME